jgi:hypothetical protein
LKEQKTMPNTVNFKKAMLKMGLPEEVISQFDLSNPEGNKPERIVWLVDQMDKLLTREQCLSIMEEQGCQKTGVADPANREFGKRHASKTLAEKIRLHAVADIPHRAPCKLNPDGTLSVFWSHGTQDGKHKCGCSLLKKLRPSVHVSPTFCGCCGGHVRHHLQNAFDVKLKLKEIVSSAVSSGGEKQCEMLFDVI